MWGWQNLTENTTVPCPIAFHLYHNVNCFTDLVKLRQLGINSISCTTSSTSGSCLRGQEMFFFASSTLQRNDRNINFAITQRSLDGVRVSNVLWFCYYWPSKFFVWFCEFENWPSKVSSSWKCTYTYMMDDHIHIFREN